MVNRVDGVILGVGVVVLVASIIGVALYDEEGDQTFTISWEEGDAQELEPQEESGGAGEFSFTAPVNGTNIATATFSVDVQADGLQVNDDTVEVAVSGPDGLSGDCSFQITGGSQSASGSCDAEVDVTEQPTGFSVDAPNRTAAQEEATEQVGSTTGNGEWSVTVTISGGQEIQEPSYTVTLTPQISLWTPQAQIPTTGPGPGPG